MCCPLIVKEFWSELINGITVVVKVVVDWGQVARTVESLGGNINLEHDTGEWSVDIGFPEHHVAIEVCASCLTSCTSS